MFNKIRSNTKGSKVMNILEEPLLVNMQPIVRGLGGKNSHQPPCDPVTHPSPARTIINFVSSATISGIPLISISQITTHTPGSNSTGVS